MKDLSPSVLASEIVEAACYLRDAGMSSQLLKDLHHFASRTETYTSTIRYFGIKRDLRSINLAYGARLLYVEKTHRRGRGPFELLVAEALVRFPTRTLGIKAKVSALNHYRFCVYTIVSRDVLDTVAMERHPLIQTEKKIWAKARVYLQEANDEGFHVPVILGDAKDCSKLLYWGLLTRVEINQSSTEYEVDRLRPIQDGHTPQELILASSGENIAPGFIRPYALCHTPAFLTEPTAMPFLSPEEGASPEMYLEGAAIRVSVNAYERNAKARRKCIDHYGCTCAACGFDFEAAYGEIGRGFIHVHHVKPLSEIGAQYQVNPIHDLRPVCPNCHAMLHTQSPSMSIEELKALIKE